MVHKAEHDRTKQQLRSGNASQITHVMTVTIKATATNMPGCRMQMV